MSDSEFAELCKKRGFSRRKDRFSRCIGDGVIQLIYINGLHISNSIRHPNDNQHYITFTFLSLYAQIPEICFEPIPVPSPHYAENVIGKNFERAPFKGIQFEYDTMRDCGFDFMDSVNTQEKMLMAIDRLEKAEGRSVKNMMRYAPHIICGQYEQALSLVSHNFMNRWIDFETNLLQTGQFEEFGRAAKKRLDEFYEEFHCSYQELYRWAVNGKSGNWYAYLHKNYERNLKYMEKYHVKIAESFQPCEFVYTPFL